MLKHKLQEDLRLALKGKKELDSSVLRLLLAAILNREKEKRYKLSREKPEFDEKELEKESQLTDEEITEVISSEIKKRKEAILLFKKGERNDLVQKEEKETEILQRYLPEQLSEQELEKLIKKIIEKVEAKEPKDMGKVMQELMPKVKGRADGSLVSRLVKELLS